MPIHLAFIDDDPEEVRTFRRLFEGERFRVTAIRANTAQEALAPLQAQLDGARPDLFVLDMYFPLSADAPGDLGVGEPAGLARRQAEIETVAASLRDLGECLRAAPTEGKLHLRQAHGAARRARDLLDAWCAELGQGPAGGIRLLELLDKRYLDVPKLFYSRKATLDDARLALRAGAVDVLSKPDPAREAGDAAGLGDAFERYAAGQPPRWLAARGR